MTSSNNNLAPLFSKEDEEQAEGFRDKVRCLFEHFDKDGDSYLNFKELAALQRATEGVILSEEMYLMACRTLNCQPSNGITLGALKVTYASDGASAEKDYLKVFPEKNTKKGDDDEDEIYEVGDDGVDISS